MIRFVKAHACGNDFLIVDSAEVSVEQQRGCAVKLCARNTGIGADGIEYLEWTGEHSGKVRLFNADGSVAEISGMLDQEAKKEFAVTGESMQRAVRASIDKAVHDVHERYMVELRKQADDNRLWDECSNEQSDNDALAKKGLPPCRFPTAAPRCSRTPSHKGNPTARSAAYPPKHLVCTSLQLGLCSRDREDGVRRRPQAARSAHRTLRRPSTELRR